MKIIKLLSHLFLLVVIFGRCTYDPLKDLNNTDFTVADAKEFFENNATDLQNVSFNRDVKSRSSREGNITPDWKSAIIFQNEEITTIEVPLKGDVLKIVKTLKMSSLKKTFGFVSGVTTKLVIQKHQRNDLRRQFVVTMIDGAFQSREKDKNKDYRGKNNYSGYIIVSAVTGEYLESFQSVNGRWTKVFMGSGTKKDLEDPQNVGLSLLDTKASLVAYDFGEESSSCFQCGNSLGMCTCCEHCGGTGCVFCTVVVYPTCKSCGQTTNNCVCCPWCHQSPCACFLPGCPVCHRIDCICDAFKCKLCGQLYCPGSCQNPGGGEGGSGGEVTDPENPNLKTDIELIDASKYAGYEEGKRNCIENAKAILDKYEITNHGSPEKVFKLMCESNDVLQNYGENPDQNYKNAMDCIDRHLDANRPIIVGVNHTINHKINEGTTDHFVLITGRKYDTSTRSYYYTYIETGRSHEMASAACDTKTNRIYFSSPPPLLQDNNSYCGEKPKKYQITQVRPNDGNTTGTIHQNGNLKSTLS